MKRVAVLYVVFLQIPFFYAQTPQNFLNPEMGEFQQAGQQPMNAPPMDYQYYPYGYNQPQPKPYRSPHPRPMQQMGNYGLQAPNYHPPIHGRHLGNYGGRHAPYGRRDNRNQRHSSDYGSESRSSSVSSQNMYGRERSIRRPLPNRDSDGSLPTLKRRNDFVSGGLGGLGLSNRGGHRGSVFFSPPTLETTDADTAVAVESIEWSPTVCDSETSLHLNKLLLEAVSWAYEQLSRLNEFGSD